MKRRSRFLLGGLAAAAAGLSCDEGRLLTDAERQPLKVEVSAPAGPAALLVGEAGTYSATVQAGESVLDPEVLTFHWTADPPGLLAVDTSVHAATITVSGISPGTATLTVRAAHPDILEDENVLQVRVLLQGVAPVTPHSGDTTLAAVGDAFTVRARGYGKNDVSAERAGLNWTRRGSALSLGTPLTGVDSLRVTAVNAGTDTLIFSAAEEVCAQGSCTDTILVRVVPVPVVASVVLSPGSHTFDALTATQQFSATALDSNGVSIPAKSFTWIDDAASPGIISVDGTGLVTADRVGTSLVIATVDGVADSAEVTVQQIPASISTAPPIDTLAVGATTTLTATVLDAMGVSIPDTVVAITWASLDQTKASVDTAGVVSAVAVTDSVKIRAHPTGYDLLRDTSRITVLSSYVLQFDGGDYGSAGDVLALGTAWTIEAWVKPENTGGIQYLLARGGSSASGGGSYGLYLSEGRPGVFIRSGPGGPGKQNDLVSATTLSTTAWSHLAVSYDATALRMYINGVATDSIAATNAPQTAADSLVFGASDTTAANPLVGRLDEVRFWSTVRTPAQIAGAYQATLAGTEADLLAWWPFTAGAGNPVDGVGGLVLALPAAPNDPAWKPEYPKIP